MHRFGTSKPARKTLSSDNGSDCPNDTATALFDHYTGLAARHHHPKDDDRRVGIAMSKIEKLKDARLEWEYFFGEIPSTHSIVFIDGDWDNLSVDNLSLVKKKHVAAVERYLGLKPHKYDAHSFDTMYLKGIAGIKRRTKAIEMELSRKREKSEPIPISQLTKKERRKWERKKRERTSKGQDYRGTRPKWSKPTETTETVKTEVKIRRFDENGNRIE